MCILLVILGEMICLVSYGCSTVFSACLFSLVVNVQLSSAVLHPGLSPSSVQLPFLIGKFSYFLIGFHFERVYVWWWCYVFIVIWDNLLSALIGSCVWHFGRKCQLWITGVIYSAAGWLILGYCYYCLWHKWEVILMFSSYCSWDICRGVLTPVITYWF